MKFFKALKKTMLIISVMYITIGILLMINKKDSSGLIIDILSYGLIITGVFSMIKYFMINVKYRIKRSEFIVGALLFSIGILLVVSKNDALVLVTKILGVAMIISGLHKIQDMFDTSAVGIGATSLYLFGFLVCAGIGCLIIFDVISAPNLFYVVLGLGMCICGISDLVSNFYVAFGVANNKEDKKEEIKQ